MASAIPGVRAVEVRAVTGRNAESRDAPMSAEVDGLCDASSYGRRVTGYRVADEPLDPLAIDRAKCAKQRYWERFAINGLISLMTAGIWLPVFLVWLAMASGRMETFAGSYQVRLRAGVLSAGNDQSSRSIPLDAIADATVQDGRVSVSVNGGQPLVVYGLADTHAAIEAILEARRTHVASLRGGARVRVEAASAPEHGAEAPAAPDATSRRA